MKVMEIQSIPLVSVSYNSAELIEKLLESFRRHYDNPVTIIDGSSAEHYPAIEAVCAKYANVKFIHFDYNIHHGPGMAWAFQNLPLEGRVLVLDSDVIVVNPGLIEALASELKPGMYGVGYVNHVNESGFDVDYEAGAVRYLHPACMLCNIEVVRSWPMPTKHGAPNIEPMLAIHRAGKHELILGLDWVKEDFSRSELPKHYIHHDWQGTVARSGSYNLEEWEKSERERAHVRFLTLSLLPVDASAVIEIGANDPSLLRAYKKVNPNVIYTSAAMKAQQSDCLKIGFEALSLLDLDNSAEDFFQQNAGADCWLLDQVLERIANPEQLMLHIRKVIGVGGCVVAVIPNVQHWSIQAKLAIGDFRYASSGLLLHSNLRLFTRASIFDLFQNAGFQIAGGFPVIHTRLENQTMIAALKQLAVSVGADPDLAIEDAQACQYIIKAIPNPSWAG